MKLQTKLLLFFVSVALISGGAIILFSTRGVHQILVQEVAKRSILKTTGLPAEMAAVFQAGDEEILLSLLQTMVQRTDALYAIALGPEGRVLAHTNVVEKGKIYTDSATREALRADQSGHLEWISNGRNVVDVYLPVWSVHQAATEEEFLLFGGKELKEPIRLGTFRIGLPMAEAFETEVRIIRQILTVMVGTGLAALAVLLVFMSKLLGRVRLLIEGTEAIGRGGYGARVPVLSKDEFGILAESFNRMSEDLAKAHTHLENEVKVRTQELESVVYTMSHDLKTPVVSMQGMASILMEDHSARIDEKGKYYIQRIIANAHYMEELIRDLLNLSRIGQTQKAPEPAEVQTVVDKILDLHREQFAEKGIEVIVQPLPSFRFERTQLTELFQNLITNAAKFMGDQPHPRIEIGGREEGAWIEFHVKDNGIGIDPQYHGKVFGVFHRLKDVEVEGTGVGLSIVKKIVDLAGGEIRIESKKGEGATFFIRFQKEKGFPEK